MVQPRSTVLVQIFSSLGQSSSPAGENVQVEVRAIVDTGEKRVGCQVLAGNGPNGTYTFGVRTGVQSSDSQPVMSRGAILTQGQMKGTRVDRYA